MRVVVMAALGLLVGTQGAMAQQRAAPTPNRPSTEEAQYQDALILHGEETAIVVLYRRACATPEMSANVTRGIQRLEAAFVNWPDSQNLTPERRAILRGAQLGAERQILTRFEEGGGMPRDTTRLCNWLQTPMGMLALRALGRP